MPQTKTYIRELFARHHFRPRRGLGQNFLIDGNLLEKMAAAAALTTADTVLEVGVGTGALAKLSAARAGKLIGVEIDRTLCAIAGEELAPLGNVELLRDDVLANKRTINPALAAKLRAAESLKVVANLPYHVSVPVILGLLCAKLPLRTMVVTVQKEVADRLTAPEDTKDYGTATVITRLTADVTVLTTLPPSVFWPRPKVSSALLRITPAPQPPDIAWDAFLTFLQGVFSQRRKSMKNALAGCIPDAERIADACTAAAVDPQGRPATVSPETYLALFRRIERVPRSRKKLLSADKDTNVQQTEDPR